MMRCRSCSIYDTLRSKERRGFEVTIWVGKPQRGGHFLWGKDDPFRHYLACTKALGVVSQYILGSESL